MPHLLRDALTHRNLMQAWQRVQANAGMAGVDGESVQAYALRLDAALRQLQQQVLGGQYQPAALKRVWLPRPGKSPRPLGVPTVGDRVLHTALAQTITPLLEAEFEDCSFAYRSGRSVRQAVDRITQLQRQGYGWVVEADIEQFFDHIPHARLLRLLAGVVRDEALVALVGRCLCAPVQDGDAPPQPVQRGVPQGSALSPLLANLYLDGLDEALTSGDFALVRYADDFIVLTRQRQQAEAALELTREVLQNLELRLNPLKTRVVNFDTGFRFLGWNFVRSLAVPAPLAGRTAAAAAAAAAAVDLAPDRPSPADTSLHPSDSPAGAQDRPAPAPAHDGLGMGELAQSMAEALARTPGWQPVDEANAEVDELGLAATASPGLNVNQDAEPADAAAPEPAAATDLDDPTDDGDASPPIAEPLRSIQRTLYITDPAVALGTQNQRLVLRRDDTVVLELPAIQVDQVVVLGRNPISTPAMVCCMQHGISLVLLTRLGRFVGRMEPAQAHPGALLQAQCAAQADAGMGLALARHFVQGKIGNAALVLQRYARHRRGADSATQARVHDAVLQLRDHHRRLRNAQTLDSLRGHEGAAAAAYFGAWRLWLPADWRFAARQQQDGADPMNALLDLGYTLLHHAVAGLLQARGLNPWLGHLHAARAGHMALASDLMEEFRAVCVDAVVLNLCLNGRLTPADFVRQQGSHSLRPEAVRLFIHALETRWNVERQHPRHNELLDLRRIIDAQVRDLAGAYRHADAARYTPCEFR